MLEVDTDAPQLAADIEFIPNDTDPGSLRLQLVILESLVIRQDNSGDPAHSNSRTRLLVNDGDRIEPGAVVARTEILCKKPGQIRGIRQGSEVVRRLLVVTEADCITTHCPNPTVQVGDLLRSGDEIGDGVITEESGQVLRIENDSVVFRIGRPYLVSPGALLQIHDADLVQRGDNIALLVFERAKTGDIIQGLPRIEELLEARKPKEMCVLARTTGTAQVTYDSDDNPEVKILGDDGVLDDDYSFNAGQSVIISDGQKLLAGEALTDGPANPHDILDIYFHAYKESLGVRKAALIGLQKVQEFLMNEVQSVYQSQGVDISDKHIEVIVKQMTSKVRIEDGGDTTRLPGELVELHQVEQINEAMEITGGAPADYTPVLMGITKASLNTDSFISAASFQETTRVLTEAAIEGKSDWLRGLKENVIIGRLIPAGTGFNAYDTPIVDVETGYEPDLGYDEEADDVIIDDNTARNYQIIEPRIEPIRVVDKPRSRRSFDDELVDDDVEFEDDDEEDDDDFDDED